MSPQHPHLDQPTEAQLLDLGSRLDGPICETWLAVHQVMVTVLPDVRFSVDQADLTIGYGAKQWGYDGWGMAADSPNRHWVNLYFLRGTDLDDPTGLLTGTGVRMRHVRLGSVDEVRTRRLAIEALIRTAQASGKP
ncbi:MAG: DUF1801 domain-containing protein [Propionibacteriaceae bacterium]|jgi:hypothetical protein|nr:DUF1801 domain-containing protein [Propionibacteriaceae bacterium]